MLTAQYFSTCTQHDTLRLPHGNTHARGIGDALTHQLENDLGAEERSHRGAEGTKGGKRGSAQCDAKECHIGHPSVGEQWNIEATITLYLSFWTTAVMGAHTLCVR